MSLKFVSYDLRKPGKDYNGLYRCLASLGAKRIVESTYCFHSSKSTADLRDEIKGCMDSNDALIVSQVDGWASSHVENTPKDLPQYAH